MTAAPGNPLHRPAVGVTCCVLSLLAFAVQDTLVKRLAEIYPVLEVITVRSIMVVAMLLGIGLIVRGRRVFETQDVKPLLLRGVVAFMAFSTYYLALTVIPLGDAAAVYMTAPLFVTVWSALYLREHVGWHRWAAIMLGFGAVVFMLDPGADVLSLASVLPLFSALCYAAIPILTRRFGLREHPLTMGLYAIASYLALCLLAGVLVHTFPGGEAAEGLWGTVLEPWRGMRASHLVLALVAGLLFTMGLLGITQAYRVARASVIAPFEYSYLLWATLLGYLVFRDVPGIRTLVGGAAVVLCGCYIIFREARVSAKIGTRES